MIRIAGVVLAALALTGCGQVSSTHSSPHSLSPVKNLVLTAAATHTRHAGSARVAMDMTMVAVDDDHAVTLGELATVWGGAVPLDQQAEWTGTNSYELLTALSPRLPRRYRA